MSRKWRYALFGSLVTAGLIGGLAAGSHRFGPRFAFADAPRHHGFDHWHGGDGFDHLCGEHREAALDAAIAYLKRTIRPTEAQVERFTAFSRSLGQASARLSQACAPAAADLDTESPDSSLEQMERLMVAGLAALRELRPSFDALYAALAPEQRETLDKLFARQARL